MQKNKKARIIKQQPEIKAVNPVEAENNTQQHIPATMESIFGSISWLMLQSPAHRYLFISDYEWLSKENVNLRLYLHKFRRPCF